MSYTFLPDVYLSIIPCVSNVRMETNFSAVNCHYHISGSLNCEGENI